jgi:hypothetical protein
MPNGTGSKAYTQVVFLFLIINAAILAFQWLLTGPAVKYPVLYIGNLILFLVGCITVQMTVKALTDKSTQVFLRMIYGSFIIKFLVFASAAFFYISMYRKEVNKPALFGCLAFYIIYTVVEVRAAMKQSKTPNA